MAVFTALEKRSVGSLLYIHASLVLAHEFGEEILLSAATQTFIAGVRFHVGNCADTP